MLITAPPPSPPSAARGAACQTTDRRAAERKVPSSIPSRLAHLLDACARSPRRPRFPAGTQPARSSIGCSGTSSPSSSDGQSRCRSSCPNSAMCSRSTTCCSTGGCAAPSTSARCTDRPHLCFRAACECSPRRSRPPQVVIALMSFPFLVFALPLVQDWVTHVKPTGYDRSGKCVP